MTSILHKKKFIIASPLLFIVLYSVTTFAAIDSSKLSNYKKGIVGIENEMRVVPYGREATVSGTGFIIDKSKGLIITNEHITPFAAMQETTISFFNGKETEATVIYVDPWQDFAILQVPLNEIPKDTIELKFATNEAKAGEEVFIIGNNESQRFSIHNGIVSNQYQSVGTFPNQSLRVNLNTRGGASGSPLLNSKGEVLGVIFGASDTAAAAIPSGYLKDALASIQKNEIPTRQETGALVHYISLDQAIKFWQFPKEEATKYIAQYPGSMNEALYVYSVLEDSPAYSKLQLGDIIWKVNGIAIGPNLYQMQKLIDTSMDKVVLEVYRGGKLVTIEIVPYDLQKSKIHKMVKFSGATFFEADDRMRLYFGTPLKSVLVNNVQPGSCFQDQLPPSWYISQCGSSTGSMVEVTQISSYPIHSLDDLIAVIPTHKI